MFKLITISNIIPRSLFITQVKTEVDLGPVIGVGGFGSVFKGEYARQPVALKGLTPVLQTAEVSRVRSQLHSADLFAKSSLEKDFCKEALTWGSISHRFILPLLGIYVKKPWRFLVSPFMANGTLAQWRKKQGSDVVEIHRLVRSAV